MRFKNSLMAVLVALPFAIACGSDCYDICEDMQDEGCNDFDHGECVHLCVDQEDFFDETDKCESDYDKVLDCMTDLDDICDAVPDPKHPDEEDCKDEVDEYKECVMDYCAEHMNKDWCKVTPPQ
jgi:hypothetical protein